MQSVTSRRLFLALVAAVLGFLALSCQAGAGGPGGAGQWDNQTVYTKVGMRVEPAKRGGGWHMYSTNHIGLPKQIPVGTAFTVRGSTRNGLELVGEDGTSTHIEFVARHHPELTLNSWLDRMLSTAPVELPGNLNSSERAAIAEGRYEVGMSREALFLSIGPPPSILSPSANDSVLTYEFKHFNRVVITFDAEGRIASIKN